MENTVCKRLLASTLAEFVLPFFGLVGFLRAFLSLLERLGRGWGLGFRRRISQ